MDKDTIRFMKDLIDKSDKKALTGMINTFGAVLGYQTQSNIKSIKFDTEEYECPVCLDSYKDVFQLVCKHKFCKECVEEIKKHAASNTVKCPMCRNSKSSSGSDTVSTKTVETISDVVVGLLDMTLEDSSKKN